MKKTLLLLFFLPFIVNAQVNMPLDKVYLGIQAGLNISKFKDPGHFRNDSSVESSRASLPLFGLNVTTPLYKFLDMKIGAVYSMRGTNYTSPVYYKIRYSYLDFPTVLQLKPSDFFKLEAGVVPSVVMSSKALFHASGDSAITLQKYGSGIEVAIHLGAEITPQKGINIGFSYEVPTNSSSFDNFRVTFTYMFERNLFDKPPPPKEDISYSQIIELKNNALLVRLKTSENQINALKKMGRTAEADELQKRQNKTNREIVAAFKKYFTFCPFYFFYSSSSADIKQKNYSGHLLNDSLVSDTNIKFSFKKAYIAEFDYLEPDTIYSGKVNYDQNKNITDYTISNTNSVEALVIRNPYFTQLKKPFPYFIKMSDWRRRMTYNVAVGMMNEQLFNFFKQSTLNNH